MLYKDFMIDDWVRIEDGSMSQICAVDTFFVKVKGLGNIKIFSFDAIPLTPEILEKNFPTPEDGVIWWKENGIIGYWIKIEYGLTTLTILLDYVHQLQHALRLCEIEKEIEL